MVIVGREAVTALIPVTLACVLVRVRVLARVAV
jgi:hypothetical protein